MDNPVSTVTSAAKSAINLSNMLKLAVGFVVVAIVFDALGVTAWLIQPVTAFKAWQAKNKA